MKKSILFSAMLWSANLFAQPFIGISATNTRSANLQAGVLAGNIEIKAAYQIPFSKTNIATIGSLQIGRQVLITNNEVDNFSFTPSIGYAAYKINDYSQYDKTGEVLRQSGITPIYSLEVGKDSFLGQYLLSASYCKGFYFGVGIKAFFRYHKFYP